jgi:hypothetical protein
MWSAKPTLRLQQLPGSRSVERVDERTRLFAEPFDVPPARHRDLELVPEVEPLLAGDGEDLRPIGEDGIAFRRVGLDPAITSGDAPSSLGDERNPYQILGCGILDGTRRP